MKTISISRIKSIINHMAELIAVLDSEGRVLLANQAALDLIDTAELEVIGHLFWETPWWSQGKGSLKSIHNAYENCLLGHASAFETIHCKKKRRQNFYTFQTNSRL